MLAALVMVLGAGCQWRPGPSTSGAAGVWALVPGSWTSVNDVSVARDGTVLVTSRLEHRVWRVTPDGVATVLAGNGTEGRAGDGGPAVDAALRSPRAAAMAPDGTVYVADSGNAVVRAVAPDGTITTVAGTGTFGPVAGVAATQAGLGFPIDVAVDHQGRVHVADVQHAAVLRFDVGGTVAVALGVGGERDAASPQAGGVLIGTPASVGFDRLGRLTVHMMMDVCSTPDCWLVPSGVWQIPRTGPLRQLDPDLASPCAGWSGCVSWPAFEGGWSPSMWTYYTGDVHDLRVAAGPDGSVWVSNELPGSWQGPTHRLGPTDGSKVAISGIGAEPLAGPGLPLTGHRIGAQVGGLAFDGTGNLFLARGDELAAVPAVAPPPAP